MTTRGGRVRQRKRRKAKRMKAKIEPLDYFLTLGEEEKRKIGEGRRIS